MRTLPAALAIGAIAAFVVGAGLARAGDPCVIDARGDFVACKDDCRTTYQDAKALCKDVAPGCYRACIDGRSECVDTATQPRTDCLDGCAASLADARAQCKTQTGCEAPADPCNQNAAFIACMNGPQLTAFTCRDGCRDVFKLDTLARAALHACKSGFKSCVHSCPPSSPSGAFLN